MSSHCSRVRSILPLLFVPLTRVWITAGLGFFSSFFSSVFCTMDVWGPLMPRGEKWEDTWLRIAISSAIRSSHWAVCWENNMTESLNFELEKTVCEHRKGTYRTYIYCGISLVLLQGRPKFLSHFSSIVSSSPLSSYSWSLKMFSSYFSAQLLFSSSILLLIGW